MRKVKGLYNMSGHQYEILYYNEKPLRRVFYKDTWWYSHTDLMKVAEVSRLTHRSIKRPENQQRFAVINKNKLRLKFVSFIDNKKRVGQALNYIGILSYLAKAHNITKVSSFKKWLAEQEMEKIENSTLLQSEEIVPEPIKFVTANNILGQQIYGARIKKTLSQKRISELIGISRAAYCQIETGRKLPSLGIFSKICKEINLDPKFILYVF